MQVSLDCVSGMAVFLPGGHVTARHLPDESSFGFVSFVVANFPDIFLIIVTDQGYRLGCGWAFSCTQVLETFEERTNSLQICGKSPQSIHTLVWPLVGPKNYLC